jgi:hypothetical protein
MLDPRRGGSGAARPHNRHRESRTRCTLNSGYVLIICQSAQDGSQGSLSEITICDTSDT